MRVLAGVFACFSVITIIGCGSGAEDGETASPEKPVVQDLDIQTPDSNVAD